MKITRILCLIAFIALSQWLSAKPRFVQFDEEMASASYIETVIITGYESGHVQFHKTGNDSLISAPASDYVSNKHIRRTTNYPTNYTAYWPKEGDEVLIVLDSNGRVSLFAEIQDTAYRFWSPYETMSVAMFWFSSPALPLIKTKDTDPYLREGECWDGCLVPKDKLYYYRQKKQ